MLTGGVGKWVIVPGEGYDEACAEYQELIRRYGFDWLWNGGLPGRYGYDCNRRAIDANGDVKLEFGDRVPSTFPGLINRLVNRKEWRTHDEICDRPMRTPLNGDHVTPRQRPNFTMDKGTIGGMKCYSSHCTLNHFLQGLIDFGDNVPGFFDTYWGERWENFRTHVFRTHVRGEPAPEFRWGHNGNSWTQWRELETKNNMRWRRQAAGVAGW